MTTEYDGPDRPMLDKLERRITGLLDHLSDPLRRTDLEKALLIVAIQPVFVVPVALRAIYLAEHPGVEPYLDRNTLRTVAVTYSVYWAVVVVPVLGFTGPLLFDS